MIRKGLSKNEQSLIIIVVVNYPEFTDPLVLFSFSLLFLLKGQRAISKKKLYDLT